jgi:hypothetical protein
MKREYLKKAKKMASESLTEIRDTVQEILNSIEMNGEVAAQE